MLFIAQRNINNFVNTRKNGVSGQHVWIPTIRVGVDICTWWNIVSMTNDNFSNFKTSSVVVVAVVVDNVAAVVAATNTEERERERESFLIQEPSHISIIPFRWLSAKSRVTQSNTKNISLNYIECVCVCKEKRREERERHNKMVSKVKQNRMEWIKTYRNIINKIK